MTLDCWLDSGDFPYLGIIILSLTIRQFHTNILESFIVLKVEISIF